MAAPAEGDSVADLPEGHLIGRRAQVRTAISVLRREQAAVDEFGAMAGAVLCGPRGIGKTAIAGEIITRLRHEGWAVAVQYGAWKPAELFAGVVAAMDDQPAALGEQPGAEESLAILRHCAISDLGKIPALAGLLRRVELLIVLDGFELNLSVDGQHFLDYTTLETLMILTASEGCGKVLFTSRYPIPTKTIELAKIDVPALSAAESRQMFLRLPALRALDREDQELLTATVGGHPRLIELADSLLRDSRSNQAQIMGELRQLADDNSTQTDNESDLTSAAFAVRWLDAAKVLLDELFGFIDGFAFAVLRQICVSRAAMTLDDLDYALQQPPHDAIGAPVSHAVHRAPGADLLAVVKTLGELASIDCAQENSSTTVTSFPWLAEHVEARSSTGLHAEHERALAMRQRRLDLHPNDPADLVEIPRHLAHLGRFDDLVGFARQAAELMEGTFAVDAYLTVIRTLVPTTEPAWAIINYLQQKNFRHAGLTGSVARLAEEANTVLRTRAGTEPA